MERSLLRVLPIALAACLRIAAASDTASEFYDAIRNDNVLAIKALLKGGATVDITDKNGSTPLMYAATAGSVASMKALLRAGASVNAKNSFDVTPLMLCATDPERTRLLLERKADPNAQSRQGRTPLYIAAATDGNAATLKLLFEAGGELQEGKNPQNSPLVGAAGVGDLESFKLVVEHGASMTGPAGGIALTNAAANGNVPMMEILLKAGVPADQPSPRAVSGKVKNGDVQLGLLTPLHLSVVTGGPDAVRLLLDRGADPNRPDIRGMTALMLAIGSDHPNVAVLRLLMAHGADPELKSKAGETALDWAAKFKNPEVWKALGRKAPAPSTDHVEVAAEGPPTAAREAIAKSAALLEQKSANFFTEGGCASCHSHNLISMSLTKVRAAGVWTPDAKADKVREGQNRFFWLPMQTSLPVRIDPPGGTDMLAYGALQWLADGLKPDATTDAMLHNMAAQQRRNGSFPVIGIARPPMEESSITSTAIVLRAMAELAPGGRKAEFAARVAKAAAWLRNAPTTTMEDRNMQVIGLAWAGADRGNLQPLAAKIIAEQRADGGWAQTPFLSSDAYATGQALVALETAGVTATDPSYRKGAAFLLRTQKQDGSWRVASRSPKFQPYFQSGFPYDHDQWISMAATAWATMGLAQAVLPATIAVK